MMHINSTIHSMQSYYCVQCDDANIMGNTTVAPDMLMCVHMCLFIIAIC